MPEKEVPCTDSLPRLLEAVTHFPRFPSTCVAILSHRVNCMLKVRKTLIKFMQRHLDIEFSDVWQIFVEKTTHVT